MRDPDVITFTNHGYLRLDSHNIVHFRAKCNDRGRPGDLILSTDMEVIATIANAFTCAAFDKLKRGYPVTISYLLIKDQCPSLFIFGIFDIFLFTPSTKKALGIIRLNRRKHEDSGFYHLFIHEFEEYFIVRYESGICKISYNGSSIWHIPLKWDDVFIKEEDKLFVFNSEFLQEGKNWRLDLNTGHKLM
jgi:hypothetical protein